MKVLVLLLCMLALAAAAFDFKSFITTIGSRRNPTKKPTSSPTNQPRFSRDKLRGRFLAGFNRIVRQRTTTTKPTTAATETKPEAATTVATKPTPEQTEPAKTEAPTEAPTETPTEAPTDAPTEAPTEATTEATTKEASTEPAKVSLTQDLVNEMKDEFQLEYRNNNDTLIKMVQLGFHHCVGGCDGCIDLKNDGNKGLLPTYSKLRNMHKKWEALISLADYLVLGAFEAATRGVSTNDFGDCAPGECTISIPFTSGRKTCANPDVGKSQNLPEGHDLSAPRRVLMNEFQLTEKEMVALLGGGHSMGRCHSSVSGFNGPWDNHPNDLDNGYFKALTNVDYAPKTMSNGKTQWSVGNDALMMLHVDMSLLYDYTIDGSTQMPSCTSRSQCESKRSSTANFVDSFATKAGIKDFHSTFATAYRKMSNNAEFDETKRQQFT